jgi:hypothetical protein
MRSLKLFFVSLVVALLANGFYVGTAVAQATVAPVNTQNFDAIGTNEIATLPANWRVDKNGTVRTVGTWAGAGTHTERRGGNSLSSTAGHGIYNFGAGPATTATDRAIGWLSSGSGTNSGNLYLHLENNSGDTLEALYISYDVEKYRNGSNPAGFRIQLYYSADGTNWTSAGANFLTSFSADANSNGFDSAPGAIVPVAGILTFAEPIAVNGEFYLAWNYSVSTGTTVTSAQALAVDNVTVSPDGANNLTPDDTPEWLDPGWQFWARANTELGDSVCIEVHPVGDGGNYIRTQCDWDTDAGPEGSNWRCDVFTGGVPAAFQSATVEYQFFIADTDTSCQNNTFDFTGFNWEFETGPTAVTLHSLTATAATPLWAILLFTFTAMVAAVTLIRRHRLA